MSIFTYVPDGLFGGLLIGISAGTLLLGNGDILGASGIAKSIIKTPQQVFQSQKWKLPFMASFFLASNIYIKFFLPKDQYLITAATSDSPVVSAFGFAFSGFLVGFGTTLGNGCTSGHGICGLARRSKRSLIAVITFMMTGMLSSSVCAPDCIIASCLRTDRESLSEFYPTDTSKWIANLLTIGFIAASTYAYSAAAIYNNNQYESIENLDQLRIQYQKVPVAIMSAAFFSIGLAVSGMNENAHIVGFLDMKGFSRGTWDPTLLFVMGGGLLVSFLSYEFVPGYNLLLKKINQRSCPFSLQKDNKEQTTKSLFNVPTNTTIDFKLVFGAATFGLGWGIGGLCPGPAMFLAANGYPSILYQWWPAFAVGSIVASYVDKYVVS